MGIAAGEMIGPLIRLINPNIVDLSAYVGAGSTTCWWWRSRKDTPERCSKPRCPCSVPGSCR